MPAAMSVGGSLCTGLLGEERSGGDFIVFTRTKQLALRCVFKNPGLIKVKKSSRSHLVMSVLRQGRSRYLGYGNLCYVYDNVKISFAVDSHVLLS